MASTKIDDSLRIRPELLKGLRLTGAEDPNAARLLQASHLLKTTNFPSLKPLLPLLLSLRGEPYTLKSHFPFEPFFRTRIPRKTLLITGRQVSKSTSMAARGIIQAAISPFFSTLFITPQYEMSRRFSQNYVRPFIDQSPVRSLLVSTKQSHSVLQRTFLSNAQMLFSFAFNSPDRVRGISADELDVDESCCGITTYVKTVTGFLQLMNVKSGDVVESFNNKGELCWDRVVRNSYHGYRQCFRITLTNGRSLVATAESWLATVGKDWKRVSDCINTGTTSNAHRDNVGRWIYQANEQDNGSLSRPTRLETARVQLSKIPDFVCVRTASAKTGEERRLRELVEQVGFSIPSGITVLQEPVLQTSLRWPLDQNSDAGVVGRVERRSAGLVVHGRRIETGGVDNFPHRGFHTAGSVADVPASEEAIWTAEHSSTDTKPSRYTSKISNNTFERRRCGAICVDDSSIHTGLHELQGYRFSKNFGENLQLLRYDFFSPRPTHSETFGDVGTFDRETLLWQPGVPPESKTGDYSQVSESTGETRTKPVSKPRAVLERSGKTQSQRPPSSSQIPNKTSGSCDTNQTQIPRQVEEETRGTPMGMRSLQIDRTAGNTGHANKILHDLPVDSDTGDQTTICGEPVEIASIEDAGFRHVWDLETEKHHTFVANGIFTHNCQDIDKDFLPVMLECLSGSKWGGIERYSGTPKSLENTMAVLHSESSQAEWVMQCVRCGYYNVPALSHDLDRIMGPWHPDISPTNPGIVCARCRQPKSIFTQTGRWIHANKELRWTFPGYHIPQQIMPMHCCDPEKWATVLAKRAGMNNTPINVFYNEVCGESYDTDSRIVTLTELKAAACLPWRNDKDEAVLQLDRYMYRVLAVDWGGGGQDGMSYTCYAVLGMLPDGRIECIWGHRSLTPHDHPGEAKLALQIVSIFKCHVLAHDYTGAGSLRETFIIQAGYPFDRIINVAYVRAAATARIMAVKPPTKLMPRGYYQVDKARSLLLTCNQIKNGWLKFFQWDYQNKENPGLIYDFIALVDEKVDSRLGKDIYTIIRDPTLRDDFAQAVNIGCCSLWNMTDKWPNIAAISAMQLDDTVLSSIEPIDTDVLYDTV